MSDAEAKGTEAPAQNVPALPRRVDAARHLINVHQARESLKLTRPVGLQASALAGAQTALTAALTLPLIYLSPFSHLIGFALLGALAALFGRFAPIGTRHRSVGRSLLLLASGVFVMSLTGLVGLAVPLQLILLALLCGLVFFEVVSRGYGPPGAVLFVFAASAGMSPISSFAEIFERTAATVSVGILGLLICVLSEPLRARVGPMPPPEQPSPLRSRQIASLRIAIGSAAAVFVAYALNAAYPAWAAISAMAVMQGTQLHITMNRALQRSLGTVLGALLVGLFLSLSPSVWTVMVALFALMFFTELVIGSNYGLGQIFVTPMALLMVSLASPAAGMSIVPERIIDTLIGAAIGMLFGVLFSSIDDRVYLSAHHAKRRGAGKAEH